MAAHDSVESIARELFSYLAERFPVCCSSDEFIYFPQALRENTDWSQWDDFSEESVQEAVQALGSFCSRLESVRVNGESPDPGERAGIALLYRVAQSLAEQFEFVRCHRLQPTFILMIATVGIVQALQDQDRHAVRARMKSLPDLLRGYLQEREPIPELFRQAGIQMAANFLKWLRKMGGICDTEEALEATRDFERRLRTCVCTGEFRLGRDVLERVVHSHMGTGMGIRECIDELEDEIRLMTGILESEAGFLGYGRDWKSAYDRIPGEHFPEGGKILFLQKEIRRLRACCIREGFPITDGEDLQSLSVEPLPESLIPVRSADSYNARPGYPYRGGVFYIFDGGSLGHASRSVHPVYRMTAAHETYPGHHLLDMCRWNHPDPWKRPLEYPLFYEGWACFAEEMMAKCGAFDRKHDRLILARRRYRHAVRGKADLLLHLGHYDLDDAALELQKAGFTRDRASETVRKYALRPAYQLCYTAGCRRFRSLFESYGREETGPFASMVLEQGEILFEDLEKVMKKEKFKGT